MNSEQKQRNRESSGRELHHWLLLGQDQQRDAIVRMHKQGWTDHGIAAATRLSVEAVRRILGEPPDASATTNAATVPTDQQGYPPR